MKTLQQLIKFYEKQLAKTEKAHNPNNYPNNESARNTCNEYIKSAQNDLEEVKNGRGW